MQYLRQSHNWINFGHFFHFFVSFLQGTSQKIMTTCKTIFTPTNNEQKKFHALATTSAFHLKLCLIQIPNLELPELLLFSVTKSRVLKQIWLYFNSLGKGLKNANHKLLVDKHCTPPTYPRRQNDKILTLRNLFIYLYSLLFLDLIRFYKKNIIIYIFF